MQREGHWNWKGGRKGDGNGYIVALIDGAYVKEHRHIIELELGRPLLSSEEVHHINGVRGDNRRENLLLTSNRSEHRGLHDSLQRAAYMAVQAGSIVFRDGEYHYEPKGVR